MPGNSPHCARTAQHVGESSEAKQAVFRSSSVCDIDADDVRLHQKIQPPRFTLRNRAPVCRRRQDLLNWNAHRHARNPRSTDQDQRRSRGRTRWHAKVHLVYVHRAGVSEGAQHLRGLPVHGYLDR